MKLSVKLIFSLLLMFCSFADVKAQQKYEFMSIGYYIQNNGGGVIAISINGGDFIEEELKPDKRKNNGFDTNPLLLKVNQYQEKGWEVMSFEVVPLNSLLYSYVHWAYLRKKKE